MRRNLNNTKIFGFHNNWRNGVKFYHRSILIPDWFSGLDDLINDLFGNEEQFIRIILYLFVVRRMPEIL